MKQDVPEIVQAALAGVDPVALRRAALGLPAYRDALVTLADALEAGDPAAALPVLEGLAARGPLDAELRIALGDTEWDLHRIRRDLGRLGDRSDEVESKRRRLLDVLDELRAGAADDPALAATLDRARERLDEAGAGAATAFDAVRRAARGLADDLGAVLANPSGPAAAYLARHGADLDAALRTAEGAAGNLPVALLDAIADAAGVAAEHGHPLAVSLSELEARLAEAVLDPADASVARRWRRLLDRALAAGDLAAARLAGHRVQAAAFAADDHRLVALVAHHVAELARARKVPGVEIIARLEQALALARFADHADDARRVAADAVIGAEAVGDAAVLARARLMHGQLLAHLGDGAEARAVLRRLMRAARERACDPAVLGRAAVVLGELEAAHQPAQATRNLRLAFDLAREHRDARLLDAVVPPLLAVHLAREREDAAVQVFREARVLYAAAGLDGRFVEALEARFGEERIAAWLRRSARPGG